MAIQWEGMDMIPAHTQYQVLGVSAAVGYTARASGTVSTDT